MPAIMASHVATPTAARPRGRFSAGGGFSAHRVGVVTVPTLSGRPFSSSSFRRGPAALHATPPGGAQKKISQNEFTERAWEAIVLAPEIGKYFPFTTFRRLTAHTRLTLSFLSLSAKRPATDRGNRAPVQGSFRTERRVRDTHFV